MMAGGGWWIVDGICLWGVMQWLWVVVVLPFFVVAVSMTMSQVAVDTNQ